MISFLYVKIISRNFFLYEFCRRTVLGGTRFAHSKKPKELEPFAVFLPRLVPEPGLVLNFSATALRNSVVSLPRLLISSSVRPWLLSVHVNQVFPPWDTVPESKLVKI